MRVIFTIILNGLHHLKHNDYAQRVMDMCDLWVIVEGAVQPGGSTNWCREVPAEYHKDGRSIDGTVEFLDKLTSPKGNLRVLWRSDRLWNSKDEQVNRALQHIRDERVREAFLWQVDCDEQWTAEDMSSAEMTLLASGGKTGCFLADYYVGKNLMAKGEWGEGQKLPYRRLWKWEGEQFMSHEPPVLACGNAPEILLPQRFKHYAYYYEQDVKFKEAFYTGHDDIFARWSSLQQETRFPQPISRLLSGGWGKTATTIDRIDA